MQECGVKVYKSGTVIFAKPEDETAIEEAKDFIKSEEYTQEQVKISRTPDKLIIVRVR